MSNDIGIDLATSLTPEAYQRAYTEALIRSAFAAAARDGVTALTLWDIRAHAASHGIRLSKEWVRPKHRAADVIADLLTPTGTLTRGRRGRPAMLYVLKKKKKKEQQS